MLWRRVCALGVAQIVSWGTLFYTIAVLGAAMRAELGVGDVVALRQLHRRPLRLRHRVAARRPRDRRARRPARARRRDRSLGALASRRARDGAGTAHGARRMALAGVAMAACLYDPAFATLHQIAGAQYRRAVTALTLFGGFASTVFWPLSQYLLDTVGWRATFADLRGTAPRAVPADARVARAGVGPPARPRRRTRADAGASTRRARRRVRLARDRAGARGVHRARRSPRISSAC